MRGNETLYFMVHAVTEASAAGAGEAAHDPPLSEDGMKEAERIAAEFAKTKPGLRVIFCSPKLCAIQTADFVHDQVSSRLKLKAIDELACRSSARESAEDFRARVQRVFEWVKTQPLPSLIVGHADFAKIMLSLAHMPERDLKPGEIVSIDLF
ncbi:MAG: phosphoglycerate mutase family protein [Oligoflexia bacterium]|nr:phosphoglycerate mutase family protein [Oligoflexia bacterium]